MPSFDYTYVFPPVDETVPRYDYVDYHLSLSVTTSVHIINGIQQKEYLVNILAVEKNSSRLIFISA